jgi:hypothetical protein
MEPVKVVNDRARRWIPDAQFRSTPNWMFHVHRSMFPYEHQPEFEQIIGRGLREIIPTTTITNVRRVLPRERVWVPQAVCFTDPFNTSTPKIRPDQVLLRPFNVPELCPL